MSAAPDSNSTGLPSYQWNDVKVLEQQDSSPRTTKRGWRRYLSRPSFNRRYIPSYFVTSEIGWYVSWATIMVLSYCNNKLIVMVHELLAAKAKCQCDAIPPTPTPVPAL